ncbi:ubiquinol-cytochrome c reductase iron-sulfur subunit (plasmid) [Deinococcus sp. KNUC1210]|uniref:QcrA and Rieske domain-containing protein n=1 Tax=Deinococcus sp. KNUC1210 TaxID=2917691 RepID=UPI001EEFF82B|nr:ubiquinol-cytochrome c reductase iron-sulfur subunit [Deinococcus sp. KNUC1210]ULH17637.1 ubiquinol-cytochrome c reductase iron-sulfur subunit [Deinococcus sp. KNUC1210]
MNDPSDDRRHLLKTLTVGGAVLLLPGSVHAQTGSTPAAVKIVPLSGLDKAFSTAEFMFDGTAALLVRLSAPPPDRARALEVKVGGTSVFLTAFTRVCTHLGCTPALPDARTHQMVCPCHGSTYSADGTVVKGPAQRSLSLISMEVRGSDVYAVALAPST